GHGVVAPAAEGVAAGDPPGGQKQALDAAMGLDGLDGVFAAGGGKAAVAAKGRTEKPLIEPDEQAEGVPAGLLQPVHGAAPSPAGASFLRGGRLAGGGAPGARALSGRPAALNSRATARDTCQLFRPGVAARATKIRL